MKNLFFTLLILAFIFQANASASLYNAENVHVNLAGNNTIVFSKYTLRYNKGTNQYSIRNLFDNKQSTAWVTKFDDNIYEDGLFKIIFNKPIYVESISIKNGYQKSKKLFQANQRVKRLNINKVIVGGPSYPLDSTIALKDIMGEQTFSLQDGWTVSVNLFRTKELIFNVFEIYNGSKYNDLCISELEIKYSDAPTYTPSLSWPELKLLIDRNKTKNADGWFWSGLNENNYKLFNDLLFYVLTHNNDAYQYFQHYKPEGVGSSEAMEFFYKKAVEESLK